MRSLRGNHISVTLIVSVDYREERDSHPEDLTIVVRSSARSLSEGDPACSSLGSLLHISWLPCRSSYRECLSHGTVRTHCSHWEFCKGWHQTHDPVRPLGGILDFSRPSHAAANGSAHCNLLHYVQV